MTDEQLSALLRLKRFEQPPPGYFDDLLVEVQRRQRTQLLQNSLWKIAFERVQVFFGEHSMGSLSYAGSMAAVVVVGVAAIGLMTPGDLQTVNPAGTLAVANPAPAPAVSVPVESRYISLQQPPRMPSLESRTFRVSQPGTTVVSQPRYVIDQRPPSYEAPPSFDF